MEYLEPFRLPFVRTIHSDEGLTVEKRALESLFGGEMTSGRTLTKG